MYSQRSISLAHHEAMPPHGSPVRDTYNQLQEDGFKITLDPRDEDPLVQEYINPAQSGFYDDGLLLDSYHAWRGTMPNMHLFVMADHIGQLVGASWVKPRTDFGTLPNVTYGAIGGLSSYAVDSDSTARFMQVTHAYTHRRFEYAESGIFISLRHLALITAARQLGYEAVSQTTSPSSGIVDIDMVVSSERLAAFNAGTPKPKRPTLRLIKGGKNNDHG